jgi:glycosyltransferase involved in cell wall biosynthesis
MSENTIGIITTPISKSGIIPLTDLIKIIFSLSKNIFLITGGEGYTFFRSYTKITTLNIPHSTSTFFMQRIFNYLSLQLKISLAIFKTSKHVDFYIFFIGSDVLLLPMVIAHLVRKKVYLLYAGSLVKSSSNDPLVSGLKILQFFTWTFADKIIVYSDSIIKEDSLERWAGKIVIARQHFIDFDRFRITKGYPSRECIIGYVGRFSEEKGIVHLLHAIPNIVSKKPDIRFLFIGDGPLKDTIWQYIQENNLSDTIILHGWVSHSILPDCFNQMKLLIIPSDTEGLPNVMLEAMACGTPVLANPVGAIPDVIIEGKTGFIMENNSPEIIAQNLLRVLNEPDLEKIAENGRGFIQENFSFEKTFENWNRVFSEIE